MSETNNTDPNIPNIPNNVTSIDQASSKVMEDRDAVMNAVSEAPVSVQAAPEQPAAEVAPAEQEVTQEVVPAPTEPEKLSLAKKLGMGVAAAVVGITAMGNLTHGKDVPKEEVPAVLQDPSVDFRTVQPGETLSETGEQVAKNINDELPEEQQVTTEQTVDAIVKMNNEQTGLNMNEKSGISAGDTLYLPGEGDGDPNKAGYQLKPTDEAK